MGINLDRIIDGAKSWVRERIDDLEDAKNRPGADGPIDGVIREGVDNFRTGAVDAGRNFGGFIGDTVGLGRNDGTAIGEGLGQRIADGVGQIEGARSWVGDRLAEFEDWRTRGYEQLNASVKSTEQNIDNFRTDVVELGREYGPVGETLAHGVSGATGLVEGAGLAVYDAATGLAQLSQGVGDLVNPFEWVARPDRNIDRVASVASTVGTFANPFGNPEAFRNAGNALTNGVTQGYQDAAANGDWAKFGGRLFVDVGSFFIGAGEVNAAVKGAQGAKAISRVGEAASAIDKAADAGRVLDPLSDAARVDDPLRSAAALNRAETAVRDGDLALAGRTADEQAEAITALSNAGRIDEARALLKPLLDGGDYDGLIARLDLTTPPNGTVFWSGNAQEAGRVATSFGGRTLEGTPGGRVLDGWDAIPAWNNGGDMLWSTASRQFASGSRGDVTVVVTRDKASTQGGDVWRNVESPVIAQLREAGVVSDVRVVILDPLNPTKLLPLTGLAAEDALRAEGLLTEPPR